MCSTTAVNALKHYFLNLLSVELAGTICILHFTLAGLKLLFILVRLLSDRVIAMITLCFLAYTIGGETLDSLGI